MVKGHGPQAIIAKFFVVNARRIVAIAIFVTKGISKVLGIRFWAIGKTLLESQDQI